MIIDRVVVVVPAHDEELLIGRCLESLRLAAAGVGVPVEIRVVLDDCTDNTAERLPGWVTALRIGARSVGAARAAGFADLLADERRSEHTWCATTDADSVVPAHWLQAQLRSGLNHDLFVGTVTPIDHELRPPGVLAAHDDGYHPHDGHRHVHGANLGLSAHAYRLIGGFSADRVHEDVRLVHAATELGLRIDWSGGAVVQTSVRRSHRTPEGFSSTMDALEQGPATIDRSTEDRHPEQETV